MSKLVFFGNERLATGVTTTAPVLRSLIEGGYEVCAVVVQYQPATSRSSKQRELEVIAVAKAHSIPVHTPLVLSELSDILRGYKADAGVLLAYGKIIPKSIIDIFPAGIVNIHPSLLPKHRGSIPLESVILQGDTKTGISLMALAQRMDAGPIYAQSEIALNGTETKQTLYDHVIDIAVAQLKAHLPKIIDGTASSTLQDEQAATYDERIAKQDGIIDWNKPAVQLEREVRAYAGWPKSQTKFGDVDVVITKARVLNESGAPGSIQVLDKNLVVFCGTAALAIERLRPAGKNEMDAASFINGYGRLLLH